MIQNIKTPILPIKQQFVKVKAPKELDYKAICIFVATGFFMGDETYWKDKKCLLPGHNHQLDAHGFLVASTPWFHWHYTPRDISFKAALDEYVQLLKTITKEKIGDNPVILPLSGGLDSRSQALVLKNLDNKVHAFSYAFQDGYPEYHIAKEIAQFCGFSFESFEITKGYLWECILELSQINGCYSEFTHPRQMAVLNELKQMEGVFSLGHWGDVFFDRGVPEGTQENDVVPLLMKKMVKPKGLELASQLWDTWNLEGDFKSYLWSRIETDLSAIKIDNLSAKVRAYKTSQWAHRWTTTNLSVFEATHPITLPYYDNRMCEFICCIPEEFLADRKLQLAHLKQNKDLACMTWQAQKPFNIYNYKYNKTPLNLPYRVFNKLKRVKQGLMGHPYIQRNWELQFEGDENDKQLKQYLFDTAFNSWIPKSLIANFYSDFRNKDAVSNSHAISMLLTLSVWNKKNLIS